MSDDSELLQALKKYAESEQLALPVLPIFDPISLRLQQELLKKDPSLQTVEKLICSDQSLTSQLLRIANSSVYRGLVDITTVRSALIRLGIAEVFRIVLTDVSRKSFSDRDRQIDVLMKKLWQHSMGCAFAAGMLSTSLDFGVFQHEAFFAGLLHDIGKLLLLKVVADIKQANKMSDLSEPLLLDAMDLLHAEHGCVLLRRLQMPEMFALVAREHHLQEFAADNHILILVRVANQICHKMGIGVRYDPDLDLLAAPEVVHLGLSSAELNKVRDFLTSTPGLFA